MFGLFRRKPLEVLLVGGPPEPAHCEQCAHNAVTNRIDAERTWLWTQEAARWGQKAGVYVNAGGSTGQPGAITLAVQSYHGQQPYAPVGLEPHEAREIARKLIEGAEQIEARRRALAA
jgi:hypothetical protein